jgi:hypothetical protein
MPGTARRHASGGRRLAADDAEVSGDDLIVLAWFNMALGAGLIVVGVWLGSWRGRRP